MDRSRGKETLDHLKKKTTYMVNNNLWCEIFDLPHSLDHCIVAYRIQEDEVLVKNKERITQFI